MMLCYAAYDIPEYLLPIPIEERRGQGFWKKHLEASDNYAEWLDEELEIYDVSYRLRKSSAKFVDWENIKHLYMNVQKKWTALDWALMIKKTC